MNDLPAEIVREFLDYSSETGKFYWKHRDVCHFVSERGWRQWNDRYPGLEAGSINPIGYRQIRIFKKKLYMAHRLAWVHYYGEIPEQFIDHINGDKLDNRIVNLRKASRSDNVRNRHMSKGAIPLKGVSKLCGYDDRYRAYVFLDNKQIHLGCFDTPEEAHAAYCAAAKKYHGEFWNPGSYHVP
jgi:hypothetical protein